MTNVEKLSYLNMVLVSLLFLITILNIIKRKELFEIKQMNLKVVFEKVQTYI